MPLDGLRRSHDSGSAHWNMPQIGVLGQPGGGNPPLSLKISEYGQGWKA